MRGWDFSIPAILLASAGTVVAESCRAVPGSKDWPSDDLWRSFNETIEGKLIRPTPPGAVCHPERPEFDKGACSKVEEAWVGSLLHANDPVSAHWNQWANDTCLPNPKLPCSGSGYPEFTVNATKTEHIQLAVNFAREHNIRLVVKNTGHDYLGRSSGGGSLSIWMHHMKEMAFEDGPFHPKGCKECSRSVPRAIMGAGGQFQGVYEFLDKYNHTIVGGSGLTVGLGGYLTGGGHGVLSGPRGLGADQVLEVEMVTPQGELITLNECQNTDLFWAVRGGGGSTFGVVTRFTIRAWPTPRITSGVFTLSSAPNTTAALGIGSLVLSKLPAMMDLGVSGYIWSTANSASPIDPSKDMGGVYGVLLVESANGTDILQNMWKPIVDEARRRWGEKNVVFSMLPQVFPSFLGYIKESHATFLTGQDKYIDSRLLSREALQDEPAELIEFNKCAAARSYGDSTGVMLVSGKGVHEAKPRGGGNAVHPFWRKSVALLSVDQHFEPVNEASRLAAIATVNRCMEPLRTLEPTAGTYLNEANRFQDNWQHQLFGKHYKRLHEIKRKVDPDDVFWCKACVGSERWDVIDGQLCRTQE